jgi:hypothetical protein
MPRWRHILHEMSVSQWPSTINDWPMWWEYNSLSSFTVHVFRFVAREGGQTKQGTLDVLNTDRGLPLGILLVEDGYTFRNFFVSPSSVLLFWEGSSLLWSDLLFWVDHLVCLKFVATSGCPWSPPGTKPIWHWVIPITLSSTKFVIILVNRIPDERP